MRYLSLGRYCVPTIAAPSQPSVPFGNSGRLLLVVLVLFAAAWIGLDSQLAVAV